MIPGFGGIINLNMIRIKVSEVYRTDDLTVVLDNLYVEQIIKCSFNGINFWLRASNVKNQWWNVNFRTFRWLFHFFKWQIVMVKLSKLVTFSKLVLRNSYFEDVLLLLYWEQPQNFKSNRVKLRKSKPFSFSSHKGRVIVGFAYRNRRWDRDTDSTQEVSHNNITLWL